MEAKTTNPTTIPAKCETLSYDGYTLQWEDDFNGPELNREDWNVELHEPGWVNHELQASFSSSVNSRSFISILYFFASQRSASG